MSSNISFVIEADKASLSLSAATKSSYPPSLSVAMTLILYPAIFAKPSMMLCLRRHLHGVDMFVVQRAGNRRILATTNFFTT